LKWGVSLLHGVWLDDEKRGDAPREYGVVPLRVKELVELRREVTMPCECGVVLLLSIWLDE
jgi:hypothetical protein